MKRVLLVLCVLVLGATPTWAAYTVAKVQFVQKSPTGLLVRVDFTGDSGEALITAPDFSVVSFADLQQQTASYLARLNGIAADIGKIGVGMTITAPTPTTQPVATPEQQFFNDLAQLQRVATGLAIAKIDPASVKEYNDLIAKVQSAFVAAYVNDPGWIR